VDEPRAAAAARPLTVYSVGHGARPLNEFIAVLKEAGVSTVADIRTAPKSRLHPHFDGAALARSLSEVGIGYVHLAGLGGWRKAHPASPHVALRTPGFRGYADHMRSASFHRDYGELLQRARALPTAFMCAETLWWRCHRRILSDRLVAAGLQVVHLVRPGSGEAHRLSKFARVVNDEPIYDVIDRDTIARDADASVASSA
jgi:uncharacterized protein (DUF488 family)